MNLKPKPQSPVGAVAAVPSTQLPKSNPRPDRLLHRWGNAAAAKIEISCDTASLSEKDRSVAVQHTSRERFHSHDYNKRFCGFLCPAFRPFVLLMAKSRGSYPGCPRTRSHIGRHFWAHIVTKRYRKLRDSPSAVGAVIATTRQL